MGVNAKKTLILLSAVLCMALALCPAALACTGFAVYGENGPVYGMNMDYYDYDYILGIAEPEGYAKVFWIYFENNGLSGNIPMLSEDGLFTTVQMQWPEQNYAFRFEEGDECVTNLAMWTPYVYSTVEEVKAVARENQPKHIFGSFHSLYADAGGNATVLEVVDDTMHFTDIEDDYLVVTNFPVMLLADNGLEAADSIWYGGVDRYKAALAYIQPRVKDFTVEDGMNALASAENMDFFSPTVYSVVADPLNRIVYLAIRADFDHIWKVSMDDWTVETYQGFAEAKTYDLSVEGVALRTLEAYALEDGQAGK